MKINLRTLTLASACVAMALTAGAVQPKMAAPQTDFYKGAKKATRAISEETWKPLGTGLFRDNMVNNYYFIPKYYEFDVEIEESEQTPGRYRLVNPYKNYPNPIGGYFKDGDSYMVIDASDPVHVYIEPSYTGYCIGQGQELWVWSIAEDYYNNIYNNWDVADAEGVCGKLEDGAITFPPGVILVNLFEEEKPEGGHASNSNGMFRVLLPGAPRLDVDLEFTRISEDNTKAIFSVTPQENVEKTVLAFVKGKYDESTLASLVESPDAVTVTEAGEVEFAIPEDGIYTLVAVPYYEGKMKKAFTLTREYTVNTTEWRDCDPAYYTEGILSSNDLTKYGFTISTCSYNVDIQESTKTPGLLRLVNPYKDHANATALNYDEEKNYYLLIDAVDPDCVMILPTDGGVGLDLGYGPMEIWSRAHKAYQTAKEENPNMSEEALRDAAKATGYAGTLKDGVITFPEEALMVKFPSYYAYYYYANYKGEFKLVLAEDTYKLGVESVGADMTEGEAEYFTLSGLKVNQKNLAPGIYVVRRGAKVSKEVIR